MRVSELVYIELVSVVVFSLELPGGREGGREGRREGGREERRGKDSLQVFNKYYHCNILLADVKHTMATTGSHTYLKQRAMASAAAVASSSSEALATSMAVRSHTMVWKLVRHSSRPWASSAW